MNRTRLILLLIIFNHHFFFSQEPLFRYGKIDNPVYELSRKKDLTIDSVTAFVNSKFSTTEHKVRAYYTFISFYISYDVKRFTELVATPAYISASGPIYHSPSQAPEEVFKLKKGVCEGISRLMVKLCEGSNIEAQMIVGDTKTPQGEIVKDASHAWNAVKLDSAWTLMDITWSFGYVNSEKEFVRERSNKYFNVDPVKFGNDHLPLDPMWQFCKRPINKSYFLNKDTVNGKYFSQNFNFSDSISTFSKKSEADKNYTCLLNTARFDKQNTKAAKAVDAYLNNQLAPKINLAGAEFRVFQIFYQSQLSKNISKNNCKRALEILSNSNSQIELAKTVLKNKSALTPEFVSVLKKIKKDIITLSTMVTQSTQLVKQLQKKAK